MEATVGGGDTKTSSSSPFAAAWSAALEEPLLPRGSDPRSRASAARGIAFLAVTIGLEVAGTLLVRKAVDDRRFLVAAFGLYFAGLSLFSLSLRELPLSVAYATWCALGTVGVAIGSHFLYGERVGAGRAARVFGTVPLVAGMYALP